ncbi:MAG: hypothetical protein LBE14_04450, partial [Treponema sp.]|nr:hypothetical protein [Treponema sp.]
ALSALKGFTTGKAEELERIARSCREAAGCAQILTNSWRNTPLYVKLPPACGGQKTLLDHHGPFFLYC